uniref:Putative acetyltransferase n=1 Tax=viral metagenome TaxID=1070528 RepID=A0A6H1ZCY0_9ZZZZ
MKLCIFGSGGGALHILQDGMWFDSAGEEKDFDRDEIVFVVDNQYYTTDTIRIYGSDYHVMPYNECYEMGVEYGHISAFDCKYKKRIAKENGQIIWLNSYAEDFKIYKGIDMGHGVRINPMCYIDSRVKIGNHVKINSQSFIGHDSSIGGYSYISQHVVLDNNVTVGEGCCIFEGSILMPKVHIGNNTVIGAGSVVTKDIPANVVAYGSPCKVVRGND